MKEFFKSLLLVALTLSAIIMTRSVFVEPKTIVESEEVVLETTDLIDYIRPQNYIFSFGDLFIKLYDDHYENVNVKMEYEAAFTSFMTSPSEFGIAKTSERIWQEQVQRKSLLVTYPFAIRLSDLLKLYHFNPIALDDISDIHVTSILFILNRSDAIYIYDDKNNAYYKLAYKLAGEQSEVWIDDLYNNIQIKNTSEDEYRTIEYRYNFLNAGLREYNIEDPNLLLTPMSTNISYPIYETVREIGSGMHLNENLEEAAKQVFGDDLSFVKKSIYSDESAIFMYGYGEEVFKVNSDGSLEYIAKANENAAKVAVKFIDGLAKSLAQINKMGVDGDSLYLSDYYQIETSNAIETVYMFNYLKEGIPLHSSQSRSGNVIEVRFLYEDLTKVEKNNRIVLYETLNETQASKSFLSILERNQIEFENQYKKDRPNSGVEDKDLYQMALQEMSLLELKYYMIGDELRPIWQIVIADTEYIIDLTSGWIIEYYSH